MEHDNPKKCQSEKEDQLPEILEQLRQDRHGYTVPDGYFDSLSARITDKLSKQEPSFFQAAVSVLSKPLVWSPVLAVVLVALTFFFLIPDPDRSVVEQYDTIKELSFAMDASFTEEVMLTEINSIDTDFENTGFLSNDPKQFTGLTHFTEEEITRYLKDQEIDTELLTEN